MSLWSRTLLHCIALLTLAGLCTGQGELQRLLRVLPPVSLEDVLTDLGPVPPLADILAPHDPDPAFQVPFGDERTAELKGWSEKADDQLSAGAIDEALRFADDVVAGYERDLAPRHPWLSNARDTVATLEYVRGLEGAERERAVRACADVIEAERAIDRGVTAVEPVARAAAAWLESLGDQGLRAPRLIGTASVLVWMSGDAQTAERLVTYALRELITRVGPEHPDVTAGLSNLSFLLTAQRAFAAAEVVFAHGLDLRRRIEGTENARYARMLFNVGQLYRDTGRFDDAHQVLERTLAIQVADAAGGAAIGMTRAQLGYVLLRLARPDEAREALATALELFETSLPPDHHERAQALQHLGIVERDAGQLERASEYLSAALEMYQRLHPGGHELTADALHKHATVLRRLGRLDRAERSVRQADEMYAPLFPTQHPYRLEARATLAGVLAAKGRLDEARAVLVENLTGRRAVYGDRSLVVANDLGALSEWSFELGDLAEARASLDEEFEILVECFGERSRRVAVARVGRASLLFESGHDAAAERELQRAFEVLDAIEFSFPTTLARAHWVAGRLRAAAGDDDAALDSFGAALTQLRRSDPRHPSIVDVALDRAAVFESAGDARAAAEAFALALDVGEGLRVRVLGDERDRASYAGRLSIARAARGLVRTRAQAGDAHGALSAAERGRARALLDLLGRSGQSLAEHARAVNPAASQVLTTHLADEDEARSRLLQAEDALRVALLETQTVESAREVVEARRRDLRACSAAVARALTVAYPSVAPSSADAILGTLAAGERLLHYTWDEDGVVLLTATGGAELEAFSLARGAREVRALERRSSALGAELAAGTDLEGLSELSRALLPAPVARALRTERVAIIVPDGSLHGLPFELLELDGEPWVARGPACVYSPSGSLWARNRERGAALEPVTKSALTLGNPTFGLESGELPANRALYEDSELDAVRLFGGRLRALPGSEQEARRVGASLRAAGYEVRALARAAGTEQAVFAAARGAHVVHLATHGFRAPLDRPYEAALALARPQQPTVAGDGFLTLDELVRNWGGALIGCDLVTLSACDTNVGTRLGDEVTSLSWGFFHAGARSVMVSLWKVDDRATLLLMDRFYERWCAGDVSKAQALAEARTWLATRSPSDNRARLAELGLELAQGARSQDSAFPRPGADPTSRSPLERFDFGHPRFWAAFVLYGQAD